MFEPTGIMPNLAKTPTIKRGEVTDCRLQVIALAVLSFGQFFSLEGQGGGANYDVWELTMFLLEEHEREGPVISFELPPSPIQHDDPGGGWPGLRSTTPEKDIRGSDANGGDRQVRGAEPDPRARRAGAELYLEAARGVRRPGAGVRLSRLRTP